MHGQKRRRLSGDIEGESTLAEVKAALAKACEEEDRNTSPGSTGSTANSAKKPRQAPQEPQPPEEPQDAAHASQAAETSKQPALARKQRLRTRPIARSRSKQRRAQCDMLVSARLSI